MGDGYRLVEVPVARQPRSILGVVFMVHGISDIRIHAATPVLIPPQTGAYSAPARAPFRYGMTRRRQKCCAAVESSQPARWAPKTLHSLFRQSAHRSLDFC